MSFKEIQEYTKKQGELEHKKRMDKLAPVAKKIIAHISENVATLPIGDDVNEMHDGYLDMSKGILQIMLDENINWVDMNFCMQLVFQPFSIAKNILATSDGKTKDLLWTALCDKPIQSLTMQEVDELLKKGTPIMDDYLTKLETDSAQGNDDVV